MKIQNLIFKRIYVLFITHEYFNEEEEQKCNIILIVLKNIFLIYVLILMKNITNIWINEKKYLIYIYILMLIKISQTCINMNENIVSL
jgi:hypothetical protein